MRWLMRFLRRSQADSRLDSELRFHLEQQIADYVAAGLPPDEARRRARAEFGGLDQVKEEVHQAQRGHFLETMLRDVRYGLRMLRQAPGFTTVAVLTLALGIGANTAVFSVVDSLVLRPLPIQKPGEVVFLVSDWTATGADQTFSFPEFREIQAQTSNVFSVVTASQPYQMDGVSEGGNSHRIWTGYVTGNFFDLLGIKPALGRLILPSEGNTASASPVLVISYAYWKSEFNADPNVVGKKVMVNGHPMTLVGVAPEGFRGLTSLLDTQGYIPLGMAATLGDAPADFLTATNVGNDVVVARLRPGVDLQQAQSALHLVAQRMAREHKDREKLLAFRAIPLGPTASAINPGHPEVLNLISALFLALAGSVLLLACVNIANLLLVRSDSRQREMAMRAALGATSARLIRHLLTESILVALLGGAAGVLLGLAASRSIGSIPLHTPLPIVLDFSFDWRVFAFAFGAALLTGILVGITPALRTARRDVNQILHDGGRTSIPGRQKMRTALVAAQVGGSLMLLIVAGLFVRSLEHVEHSALGFDPKGVLNISVDPHEAGLGKAQGLEFFDNLLQRARALPGVQSASLAFSIPMGWGQPYTSFTVQGYQPKPGEPGPATTYSVVSPGYFATMRIPMLRGHGFLDSDTANAARVAIVSRAMADQYWPGEEPLGRQFTTTADPKHPLQIVGVVGDVRTSSFETAPLPFFYVPLAQWKQPPFATLQVRTGAHPEAMTREMIAVIHSVEPAMPVFAVEPMTAVLKTLNGFLIFQLAAALAGCLGILGLALAVVGVYGVISYATSQRTHEIGVRMALGAQTVDVLRMMFRQGLSIVSAGLVVGLIAAAGMARIVGNFLVGVPEIDPLTYSAAALVLALVALLACSIPARRAMRVDPVVALRHE